MNKNTALIVDPRDDVRITHLIHDFQQKLGPEWIIVFYCGKSLKSKMAEHLNPEVEVRELDVSNFNSMDEYNDFMKRKDLWESLYGNFVLTFQFDTYIINQPPYTIQHFIDMNKSYIGGNMDHSWTELIREKICTNYRNFNGGLSLRKRFDMIKIINAFGVEQTTSSSPKIQTDVEDVYFTLVGGNMDHSWMEIFSAFGVEQTTSSSIKIQTDAEDVYFTLGCYFLDLPIGDDEACSHFCVNRILVHGYFGVHKPIPALLQQSPEIAKRYCPATNKFIL